MEKKYEERKIKIDAIVKMYMRRETQEDIIKRIGIKRSELQYVLQHSNFRHTRLVTMENIRENELIHPCVFLKNYGFLDKYDINDFYNI